MIPTLIIGLADQSIYEAIDLEGAIFTANRDLEGAILHQGAC